MTSERKLVSVIIPTRDCASTLDICLTSLRRQTHPSIEIIVVDQRSRDGTVSIAHKFADRIVSSGRPAYYASPSFERNCGARYASGSYLLHLDSDMELSDSVVEECLAMCATGNEVVTIPEIDMGEGFWSECKKLERSLTLQDSVVEAPRFFARKAFEAVNGYDEPATSTEDWALHQKLIRAGFKTRRIHATITHHIGRLTLRRQLMKKYYYGRRARGFLSSDPNFALRVLSPMKPAYLRNWRQLLKSPRFAVGLSLLRSCELYAALIGSIVGA